MAATTTRPGRPSRLFCGVLLLLLRVYCQYGRVLVLRCVCCHTPPLVFPSCMCLAFPVTVMLRHAHSRVLAVDGNQCRVKGCRTAARVKFCEGQRTCAHGSTTPTHLEGCPHNERSLSPVFRTQHPDLRRRRIDSAVSSKNFAGKFEQESNNFAGNFEQEFFQTLRSGDTLW